MPGEEGKASLFKTFAGLDALRCAAAGNFADGAGARPSVWSRCSVNSIWRTSRRPHCFEWSSACRIAVDPVFHDDQHGTAGGSAWPPCETTTRINKSR